MTPEREIVHLGGGDPRELDVAALRRDLAALWETEAEAGTLMKACQGTLVMPLGADGPDSLLLDELVRLYPSRGIVVRSNPGLPHRDVEAAVSASCHRRAGGGGLVCVEMIRITAGPETDSRVASGIRSFLAGGVPVVVVAEEVSPLEVGWVMELEDTVDLVLGDSGRLSLSAGLAFWDRCLADGERTPYRDVLWSRVTDWRRALAMWFDRREQLEELERVSSIELAVVDTPGAVLKAWLLLGWLSSRLGWSFSSGEPRKQGYRFRGPQVTADVSVRAAGGTEDDVEILTVDLDAGDPGGSLRWRRCHDARGIVVERGRDGRALSRLNYLRTDRARAVLQVIHQHGPDPVAEGAFRTARNLGRLVEGSQ